MSTCKFHITFTSDTNIFYHNLAVQWILLCFQNMQYVSKHLPGQIPVFLVQVLQNNTAPFL